MGNILVREGNYYEAIKYYQSLIDSAPDNPDGLILMGLLSQQQLRFDLAAANFTKALAISPNRMDIFSYLIKALISSRQTESAIAPSVRDASKFLDVVLPSCVVGVLFQDIKQLLDHNDWRRVKLTPMSRPRITKFKVDSHRHL